MDIVFTIFGIIHRNQHNFELWHMDPRSPLLSLLWAYKSKLRAMMRRFERTISLMESLKVLSLKPFHWDHSLNIDTWGFARESRAGSRLGSQTWGMYSISWSLGRQQIYPSFGNKESLPILAPFLWGPRHPCWSIDIIHLLLQEQRQKGRTCQCSGYPICFFNQDLEVLKSPEANNWKYHASKVCRLHKYRNAVHLLH